MACRVGGDIGVESMRLLDQLADDGAAGVRRHAADVPYELLPVYIELAAEFRMVFNQFHRHAAESCVKCSVQAGRTAADDQRVINFHSYFPFWIVFSINMFYYNYIENDYQLIISA